MDQPQHPQGPNLVEQALERIRQVLAKHPTDERDRRFELACHAVAGLASRNDPVVAERVAEMAVQIADATLRLLATK